MSTLPVWIAPGRRAGRVTSGDDVPVFENPGSVGWGVRVEYNPGLRRYLLATFTKWDGSWGLYDAPEPWGQWTTVATYDRWIDATPKFGFTFPPKWMSADGKTMWMVFSGTKAYDSFNAVKGTLRLKRRLRWCAAQ